MMTDNTIQKSFRALLFVVALLGISACSSDEQAMDASDASTEGTLSEGLPAGWVTTRGEMKLSVTDYDAPTADATEMLTSDATASSTADATRAGGSVVTSWGDGSKIYMTISILSGEITIPVVAVYSNTFAEWSFSFDASAEIPATGTMVAHYIKNAVSSTYTGATLGEGSVVYTDSTAQFSYENGTFMVGLHMKPAYTRLRLAGVPAQQVTFSGMKRASSYTLTLSGDSFTYEDMTTSLTVSSTAEAGRYFTPYVYGRFNEDGQIRVSEEKGNMDMVYERTVTPDEQRSGNSLWLSMPSQNYIPKGWKVSAKPLVTCTVSGVSFNMIRVEKGTFQMGSTTNTNEQPIHSVTLTKDYYIGETEVTQELWQAVMGSNPSSYTGTQRPVEKVSWNDCQNFITKLNSLTGMTFRLPSEAEWEFAARGGNQSQGYTYSGSNTIGNVACYWGNYSSGHNVVKSKAPNELGIYDMSGNVYELCQDWYDTSYYSSSPSTDPTGPASGSYRVARGGSWRDNATGCRCAHRSYSTPADTHHALGLRLASQ